MGDMCIHTRYADLQSVQHRILPLVSRGRSDAGPPLAVCLLLLKTPRSETGLTALALSWSQVCFTSQADWEILVNVISYKSLQLQNISAVLRQLLE